jgi:hypothetical protein
MVRWSMGLVEGFVVSHPKRKGRVSDGAPELVGMGEVIWRWKSGSFDSAALRSG